MDCPRCQGLMRPTELSDPVSGETLIGVRCLLCGEILDTVIEANRKCPTQPVTNRARLPIVSC
jgi:hypothetical protein